MKEVDMSPEAITERLKLVGQLWELGVSLSKAVPIEKMELVGSAIESSDALQFED